MPMKDPKAKAEATKMAHIRKRLKDGKRVTQADRAKLDDYDSRVRMRKGPKRTQRASEPSGPARGSDSPTGSEGAKVQVQSTLPGEGGGPTKEGPPPIDIGGGSPTVEDAESPSSGPAFTSSGTTGNASSSATGAATSSNRKGPALNAEEAEAGAEMVSSMVTRILMEFNNYNLQHGASGISEELAKVFKFSLKRICIKYGTIMDEDTYDFAVIGGTTAWVGYNSWIVYRHKKANPDKFQPQPKDEKAAAPQPQPSRETTHEQAPASPNAAGIRQPNSGGGYARPQLQRRARPDFDPSGAF